MDSDLRSSPDAAVAALLAGRPVVAIRHPLGFVCLPLARQTGSGICLHVWTSQVPRADLTTSPVHCHSWDLESTVLYGAVGNEQVYVAETTDRPTHRLFDVYSRGDIDEIRATDTLVRCSRGEIRVSRPGEIYRLLAGQFHNTVVPNNEAATLAVWTGRPGRTDRSVGPVDVPTHFQRRQHCGEDESVRTVRIVAKHLVAAGSNWLSEGLEEIRETGV